LKVFQSPGKRAGGYGGVPGFVITAVPEFCSGVSALNDRLCGRLSE